MAGKLWGVGVGPGDSQNLTLKAINIIKECDVIAVPGKDISKVMSLRIVMEAFENLGEKLILCQDDTVLSWHESDVTKGKKHILGLDMPMTRDKEVLSEAHKNAAGLIAEELGKGRCVAFLTLGDPCIYSTYIYVQRIVENMGYETGIINGIPAACATGAIFNIPLGLEAEEIHIIPLLDDVTKLKTLVGTKVIMKPSANYHTIKDYIKVSNLEAVMVENAGMDEEKRYYKIDEFPESVGYFATIIVK